MVTKPVGRRKLPVNITMDADLLGRLDEAAAEEGVTRSELIRQLAEARLGHVAARTESVTVAGREFTVSITRDRRWWIGSVDELPGCGSQGRTLQELREMIADVIEGYLIVRGDIPDHARASAAG